MESRVVLVEDHLAYRDSFRLVITQETSFVVVGEAKSVHDAPALIEKTRPDLLIADFILPDGNAVSLLREMKRRRLRVPTLILGRIGHPLIVHDALKRGATGIVHKQESLAVIKEAMGEVLGGRRYISPMLRRQLRDMVNSDLPLGSLSNREREVLFLLIEGQSSKEIGSALYLSAKTVDAHRLRINRKLGVRSPAGLTRLVADHGLLG
jgi:DNA-binding NarL/FixJ family response regulator